MDQSVCSVTVSLTWAAGQYQSVRASSHVKLLLLAQPLILLVVQMVLLLPLLPLQVVAPLLLALPLLLLRLLVRRLPLAAVQQLCLVLLLGQMHPLQKLILSLHQLVQAGLSCTLLPRLMLPPQLFRPHLLLLWQRLLSLVGIILLPAGQLLRLRLVQGIKEAPRGVVCQTGAGQAGDCASTSRVMVKTQTTRNASNIDVGTIFCAR